MKKAFIILFYNKIIIFIKSLTLFKDKDFLFKFLA